MNWETGDARASSVVAAGTRRTQIETRPASVEGPADVVWADTAAGTLLSPDARRTSDASG